jgi:hypothetical protein
MTRNSDSVTVGTHVKLMSSVQWLRVGASGYKDMQEESDVGLWVMILLLNCIQTIQTELKERERESSSVLELRIAEAGHTFT